METQHNRSDMFMGSIKTFLHKYVKSNRKCKKNERMKVVPAKIIEKKISRISKHSNKEIMQIQVADTKCHQWKK